MKTASAPLLALLNGSNAFRKADLYTITLVDGTIIRTTSADVPLTFGGNVFPANAPILTRAKVRTVIGIQVDTLQIVAYPRIANATTGTPDDLLAGLPWLTAARQGALDGAFVRVETAYVSTWPTVVGTLVTFYGRIGDIDVDRTSATINVLSALELLNIQMPRNLYQSVCLNTVYDGACQAVKASFTVTGSVSGGSSVSGFTTALAQASGYFEQGVLTFTSGANAGLKRTVNTFSGGVFSFALPWPYAPLAGDTFSVFAGCDKTQTTCRTKFANEISFRGFNEIPVPETTM